MIMSRFNLVLLCAALLISSCAGNKSSEQAVQSDTLTVLPDSLGKYFSEWGVKGSFVALEMNSGEFYIFDTADVRVQSSPASTFKIFNSLVGFEEGILKGASDTFKWDGVKRNREEWNQDQSLQEAFRNSTVWFYQRIAARAGEERMQHWIDACSYGNRDISGGITEFWLSGALRISPMEQVLFMQRLMSDSLPFSPETMRKVRELMLLEEGEGYKLGAKTGWAYQDGIDIGWFTGYVRLADGAIWVFATRILPDGPILETFPPARTEISRAFLRWLKVLP
jgi:beta-lactamase class D